MVHSEVEIRVIPTVHCPPVFQALWIDRLRKSEFNYSEQDGRGERLSILSSSCESFQLVLRG